MLQLILYSKPGCHLCEGLQEKLVQIQPPPVLEVRDITSRDDWFAAYEYEIPVLVDAVSQRTLPRPSPRATVAQLEKMLAKYLSESQQNETK
ncbi:MAG: glutaredoxin family protein [Pegethrix bostrychoides GSE-TBD4-15B]|jgi:predicted PilT family ATPase|uniref:Glutaredoxin family protein n=1 Tax=Pegethrix bostrychoides GSE-TBD4-15B TaxID=2839662 RepID=A0A951PCU6_9CYAN|nr:glutaredoxin family protein [Pegethrix bostrychoides GSE-TBD4-15B]